MCHFCFASRFFSSTFGEKVQRRGEGGSILRFAGKIFFGFYGSAPPFQGKFLVLRSVKLLSSAVSQFFNDAVKNILPSPLSTRDLRETLWGEQNLLQLAHKKQQKIVTFSRKSIQAKNIYTCVKKTRRLSSLGRTELRVVIFVCGKTNPSIRGPSN